MPSAFKLDEKLGKKNNEILHLQHLMTLSKKSYQTFHIQSHPINDDRDVDEDCEVLRTRDSVKQLTDFESKSSNDHLSSLN